MAIVRMKNAIRSGKTFEQDELFERINIKRKVVGDEKVISFYICCSIGRSHDIFRNGICER